MWQSWTNCQVAVDVQRGLRAPVAKLADIEAVHHDAPVPPASRVNPRVQGRAPHAEVALRGSEQKPPGLPRFCARDGRCHKHVRVCVSYQSYRMARGLGRTDLNKMPGARVAVLGRGRVGRRSMSRGP